MRRRWRWGEDARALLLGFVRLFVPEEKENEAYEIGRSDGGLGLLLLVVVQVLAIILAASISDALELGYYASSCPDAEEIVRNTMERLHYNDNSLAPAMIRMLFHDCFVRGCDASVMIVPTRTRSSERVAIPNQTLRGFNAVDAVKRALEAACPRAVSCADALALMARDAVLLLGGVLGELGRARRCRGSSKEPLLWWSATVVALKEMGILLQPSYKRIPFFFFP
ncbi:hypothetical protein EJB05_00241, partial [Eragrostis curvula]